MMNEQFFSTYTYHNYVCNKATQPIQMDKSHDALVANRAILSING